MSGGHFNYAYSRVETMAEELDRELNTFSDMDMATLKVLAECAKSFRATAMIMKEVEWLYSGDNGPESFVSNVEPLLAKLRNSADWAVKILRDAKRKAGWFTDNSTPRRTRNW